LDMASGLNGVMFAATYPQRARSLIVGNLHPSFPELRTLSAEERKEILDAWGGTDTLQIEAPRLAHDPVLRQWWGRAQRLLMSPEMRAALLEWATRMDVGSVLPAVRVPTLVLHRRENRRYEIETSRAAASQISDARFVELPGSEHPVFLGDTAPVL